MADFWLGAVVGGCAVAVIAVWAAFWLYRRHLEALEAAKIHLEAVRRAHYESDLRWRRRAADWDNFAGQVLAAATNPAHIHLLSLLPAHSTLRRPDIPAPADPTAATAETEELAQPVPPASG
jgi:hypothetical protein